MDRPPHDYAAAMAFAQQQQYGFPPPQQQQQQFPPPHGPPFLNAHPSSLQQQYPFHRHLPPQPQHPLPPHHLLHPQQQTPLGPFPPHLPPHMPHPPPPHLLPPFDHHSPPPPSLPPSDPDLQKRIDKLVEYSAKNGPEFEAMIRDKQQDNPAYAFLFGGEGHAYYRYRLWLATARAPTPAFPPMPPPMLNPPSSLSPAHGPPMMGAPPLGHQMYPPFYDQQQQPPHSQASPYLGRGGGEYESPGMKFKGLSGPLPTDVAMELTGVLAGLTGTKESIKGAKTWFMQRSPFAPALAEALRDRVFTLEDSEKQLHIIFLANDILFDSLQRRVNPRELDNEALAFKPVLGSMLARVYHNPQNKDANQSRLEKIVQFWASKEVYDQEMIHAFENEMAGGALNYRSRTPDMVGSMDSTGAQQQMTSQWQSEKRKRSDSADMELPEKLRGPAASASATQFASSAPQQMLEPVRPAGAYGQANPAAFPGSVPMQTSLQSAPPQMPPTSTAGAGDQAKPPPYPLFPPGLIPGMVRKMQIGSGVPYSPLSPLDIPTVIPPSTVSPSEILERVSKFFKEIGEVNPSEGPMKPSDSVDVHGDYEQDEYEREVAVRKGGACIPPPPSLQQADLETGMYPDGSVERKPGSNSSGRLGLGATADLNEVSQYDDVYTSYRKQRSTTYHSSMSARSSAR